MKTLTEFLKENGIKKIPEILYEEIWFAYKGGQVFGPFELESDAAEYSNNYEKVDNSEFLKYQEIVTNYDEYICNELKITIETLEYFNHLLDDSYCEIDYENEHLGMLFLLNEAFKHGLNF